jgi:hypothetical protein
LRFAICNPEGHVFAAEGLFLAHDFPFYCGIRVEQSAAVELFELEPATEIATVLRPGPSPRMEMPCKKGSDGVVKNSLLLTISLQGRDIHIPRRQN